MVRFLCDLRGVELFLSNFSATFLESYITEGKTITILLSYSDALHSSLRQQVSEQKVLQTERDFVAVKDVRDCSSTEK